MSVVFTSEAERVNFISEWESVCKKLRNSNLDLKNIYITGGTYDERTDKKSGKNNAGRATKA